MGERSLTRDKKNKKRNLPAGGEKRKGTPHKKRGTFSLVSGGISPSRKERSFRKTRTGRRIPTKIDGGEGVPHLEGRRRPGPEAKQIDPGRGGKKAPAGRGNLSLSTGRKKDGGASQEGRIAAIITLKRTKNAPKGHEGGKRIPSDIRRGASACPSVKKGDQKLRPPREGGSMKSPRPLARKKDGRHAPRKPCIPYPVRPMVLKRRRRSSRKQEGKEKI